MNQIKEHFETEAKEFDEIIIKLIPYYNQMVQALVDTIYFDKDLPIRVIDLGCGTGTIAKTISDKFPNSKIVCLDIASNMIDIAKHKLSLHKDTNFILGDFSQMDFNEKFDVVVSSLALHHLENDNDKIKFYTKIYDILVESGQFVNADVVLASTDYHQILNINRWIEYINKTLPMDEILNKWIPSHKSEDNPAKLIDQLKWLEMIGFKSVDVIWKYYNFSVYGGIK
ncbi:MAG: class I SAM-dependent methyltransferase [Bacteroidales bacterium]|nr:class I SAM-dependent methyltransferase [Bacteroidales bacterium]